MRVLLKLGMFSAVFALFSVPGYAQLTGSVEPTTLPTPSPAPTTFHNGWAYVTNGQLVGHAVALNNDGGTTSVAGAMVRLLKDAAEIGSTVADENGEFVFPNVGNGTYGITVESTSSFAAYSFRTVSSSVVKPLEVYSGTMARPDVEAVWQSLWSPDDPSMRGNPAELAIDGSPVQSPVVRMKAGKVVGRIVFENSLAIPSRHFVKVFSAAGEMVGTARVGNIGDFEVAVPGPGLYNFIVGGQAYGCAAVRVIAENGMAQNGSEEVHFVSSKLMQAASDYLIISVIGPPAPGPVEEIPGPIAGPGGFPMYGPGPMPGGGFGGGGGGFGGGGGGLGAGGGGLGGLGGLLGVAGLAAGVVALADDDNNIASPVIP